jgi:hypothetical protein
MSDHSTVNAHGNTSVQSTCEDLPLAQRVEYEMHKLGEFVRYTSAHGVDDNVIQGEPWYD